MITFFIVSFLLFVIFTVMTFGTDVTAFAKQEKAYRIRLAGLMALVLALALIILPAFKSHIVSISSDSRLLKACDLCGFIEHDKCPNDPNKKEPGVCGCGVPDNDTDGDGALDCQDECPRDPGKTKKGHCGCGVPDTDKDGDKKPDCDDGCPDDDNKTSPGVCGCGLPDIDTDEDGALDCKDECPTDASKTSLGICGCFFPDADGDMDTDKDGTPDCQDNCPLDANKTSPGTCGCGVPDTDIDIDEDGTPDCIDDDCIYDDPTIISICDYWYPFDCAGCSGRFYKVWKYCEELCLDGIDYCLT